MHLVYHKFLYISHNLNPVLRLSCFSVELATEARTNHIYCGLEGSKGAGGGGGSKETWNIQWRQMYILKRWFPVNANCFIKCICMQRIKYSWILCLRTWLHKSTPFFSIRKAGLQHYARNRYKLATTQFGCRCFNHAVSEQAELLLLPPDLLCADWSLTTRRTRLSRQFYWKTL
jgi:hypothetical protein